MAFRQRRSTWPGAPDQSLKELEAIGIPDFALRSETDFIEYLTKGAVHGSEFQLNDLTDDQFWELFDIVTGWYDMAAIGFKACEQRRISTPCKE